MADARKAKIGRRPSQRARAPSVGFFAPSGYLTDPSVIDQAAQYFSALGWRVSASEGVFAREQRFAGPDAQRAAELERFATDRTLDVAVAARGGYGLTRILDRLDYKAIRAAGRPLVGYSDFTAFNLAYLARVGGVSFQGPSAADFSLASGQTFTTGEFFNALTQETYRLEFPVLDPPGLEADLDVRGRLWGGNLAMVCSLLGTEYFPRVRGGILFLEDVNEPAYRIERMLLQLLQADVLGRQKVILLGDFAPVPSLSNDNGYGLSDALEAVRARCPVPIISGLPFGHAARRATLAVGARARLQVRQMQACLQYQGHPRMRAP